MRVFIKPLIFILVLLGLSGVAYWDEITSKTETELKESKSKLFGFNPEEVVKISFSKLDEEGQRLDIKMEKEGSRWMLSSPMSYPGDSEGIQRLLKTIEDVRFEKSFEVAADKLKDFGLDKPKINMSLTDKAGSLSSFSIGAKSPTGFSSYLKIGEGSQVYLVSHYIVTATSKELADFRDKSLRFPAFDDIKAIGYQYENEPILTLSRIDQDWLIQSPQNFKADANEVKSFFTFFERQTLEKFIDDPSPALRKALSGGNGGTRKLATLVLTGKDGKLTNYALLENNDQVYTSLPGYNGIIVLNRKIKDGLKKTVKDLQFRNMFSYNSTEATEVDRDGKIFVKKGEHWLSKEGSEEADFIRLLLVDFEFAKAERVLSKAEAQPKMNGSPLHTIKISFKDGKKLEFSIWKIVADPEGLALKTSDEGYFLASTTLLDNFAAKPKPSPKEVIGNEG